MNNPGTGLHKEEEMADVARKGALTLHVNPRARVSVFGYLAYMTPASKGKCLWIFGVHVHDLRVLSRHVKTLLAFLPAPEGCARLEIHSCCTFACQNFHVVQNVWLSSRCASDVAQDVGEINDWESIETGVLSVKARGERRIAVRCCCRTCS